MQHYLYQGTEYKGEQALRKAIFERERKVFGKPQTIAEWVQMGVQVLEAKSVVTEEQMEAEIRAKRDYLLKKSDFYVMTDYPSTEKGLVEVKTYRQALRDITKQPGFPKMVTWPDKPSVF